MKAGDWLTLEPLRTVLITSYFQLLSWTRSVFVTVWRVVRWFQAAEVLLSRGFWANWQEPRWFVTHFHRWRNSPCALSWCRLVKAHLVRHVPPVKSASPPAFLREHLPEESKLREESGTGMLGQSPHLIGGILWIQNPMRGMWALFLRARSSGMIGMRSCRTASLTLTCLSGLHILCTFSLLLCCQLNTFQIPWAAGFLLFFSDECSLWVHLNNNLTKTRHSCDKSVSPLSWHEVLNLNLVCYSSCHCPLTARRFWVKSQFGAFLWSFSVSSSFGLIRDSELPFNWMGEWVSDCACARARVCPANHPD